jgi:hypothetical protein
MLIKVNPWLKVWNFISFRVTTEFKQSKNIGETTVWESFVFILNYKNTIQTPRIAEQEPSKIHSSIKAMRTLEKSSQSQLCRALKINQRLVITQGVFIQEKCLNLNKNSRFCGSLSLFPSFSPQLHGSLKSRQPHNHVSCEKL